MIQHGLGCPAVTVQSINKVFMERKVCQQYQMYQVGVIVQLDGVMESQKSCGCLAALEHLAVREQDVINFIHKSFENKIITDLNDLWRFNMSDSMWTWMSGSNKQNHFGVVDTKGVPHVDFMPSSRDSASGWYDINTKEIWLFSGEASQGLYLFHVQQNTSLTNIVM